MNTPSVDLEAVLEVIRQEARINKSFAAKLQKAAAGLWRERTGEKPLVGLDGKARRRNRRAPAVVDPFTLYKSGEVHLDESLRSLNLEQLRDVVAEHGMDTARLALKWKDPERLRNFIIETVKSRSRKGDAFRPEKLITIPTETPLGDQESRPRPVHADTRHLGPKPEFKAEVKAAVRKLDEETRWFIKRLDHLASQGKAVPIPKEAGWREVAVLVRGSISPFPPQLFLDHLFAHQPKVTGWPIWIDSRRLPDSDQHPYPNPPGWEALVRNNAFGRYTSDLVDFWRIEPVCSFYHRRLYYEDILTNFSSAPGKGLDFTTSISMVAEAISVATAFAGALSANPSGTYLEMAFRWSHLRGRKLDAFLDPARDLFSPKPAYQDEVLSVIEVELTNQRTTLARFVGMAIAPLFEAFGYSAAQSVIDDIVDRTIKRTLG